ncbi:ArnT family glycosyltransferase [Paludisphaera soli]|uniref:ArnT family glycosyltransferase n=1 Tax=Paludisphaera soli TaxID=2712865 RepID=UPI0013EC9587|nr:glycosyltransferase family 39 protein [Paludisphaera soli]
MRNPPGTRADRITPRRLGLSAGLVAAILTLATLRGPGLTIDEPLDVRPGRDYVALLARSGWRFFERANVDALFRDNAEHPPLGRWLLGIASKTFEPFEDWIFGPDPTGLHVLSGRVAPALAFAGLVGLIAAEAGRRWGLAAGVASAWSLIAMPRVFSHAHLAALDTFLALFWTLALLAAARAVDARRPLPAMLAAGLLWGMALLTKIHAWFLAPLILAWALVRLGTGRALGLVAGWTAVGVATFVAGWPWLWHDTLSRWGAFWGTGIVRTSLRVEYLGRIWSDREIPWHYPWVYFAVTVPVLLHALAAFGLARAWKGRRDDPFPGLLAGSILLFLLLFSLKGPVYDGERLFLLIFPAWAMLAGLGFAAAWGRWGGSRAGRVGLVALMLTQGGGTATMHPFGLSYYNLMVGGLPGAERLGLEPTYWGDAVDRVLLDELARRVQPGQVVALAPTLYPGQGVATTTAALVRRDVVIRDESAVAEADWILVSRRRAYWSPELTRLLADPSARRVAARSRQGVWLSGLWSVSKRPEPSP